MASDFTSIKSSIWKSRVNSGIGIMFLGTCALWAGLVIVRAAWGVNPVETAFAMAMTQETQAP